MRRAKNLFLFLEGLILFVAVFDPHWIRFCVSAKLLESEAEPFSKFIRAVDPRNELKIDWTIALLLHPCSGEKMIKGVRCNLQKKFVTEIRLENSSLGGKIDADSLCKLQDLRVLNLARNHIHGEIPDSISNCTKLVYLNLSSNNLTGKTPEGLVKLKTLKGLDISKNNFSGIFLPFVHEINYYSKYIANDQTDVTTGPEKEKWHGNWATSLPMIFGLVLFFLFIYFVKKMKDIKKPDRQKEIPLAFEESLYQSPQLVTTEEVKDQKPEEKGSEFVCFGDENERFRLEDLLESTADLRKQSICSSLYKVRFRNGVVYAVKRLKNFQVSFEEFGQVMSRIGNLKHHNILPLVAYHSTDDEKLLIYKYQSNGSLLSLLEDYIEGKKEFSWRLRLSIATGIAQGLNFIHQNSASSRSNKIIPHGNLKLSNVVLDENRDPLISEYGISKILLNPKKPCMIYPKAYAAPEKALSEKGDVYSFGVILLELLTGRSVEKTKIDLLKWVKAIVREEWTGEVFDKEVSKGGRLWAFRLLNVALKCLSDSPYDRPTMAEVLLTIEEVMHNVARDDNEYSFSSISSMDYSQQDFGNNLLHTAIPEDISGSN